MHESRHLDLLIQTEASAGMLKRIIKLSLVECMVSRNGHPFTFGLFANWHGFITVLLAAFAISKLCIVLVLLPVALAVALPLAVRMSAITLCRLKRK